MRSAVLTASLPIFAILAASVPAQAIIVGGTSGTGTNNDTEAGLQSYLSGDSLAPFGHWANLVRVNDASGVYLGYNAGTGNGWVLGAAHVANPVSVTVAGTNYTVSSTQQVAGTDLLLLELSGVASTSAAALPTISLASVAASTNEFVLMAGRGYTTSSVYPYPWGGTTTSDTQVMRWGTNRVSSVQAVDVDSVISTHIITDFDSPSTTAGPGAVTAYEGQVAVGDSGGGLFAYRGGQWVLVGIGHYASDTGGSAANSAEHGDTSGYTDIDTYRSGITTITGALIPEPSAAALISLSAGLLFSRRRRK